VKHVCNFVEKRRKENTVVKNDPHRHDLIPCCVNNEMVAILRYLYSISLLNFVSV
jgi:hypothetical protein